MSGRALGTGRPRCRPARHVPATGSRGSPPRRRGFARLPSHPVAGQSHGRATRAWARTISSEPCSVSAVSAWLSGSSARSLIAVTPVSRRRRSGPLRPRPDASSDPPPLRSPRAAWLPRLVPWQGPPRPLWPSPAPEGSCFAACANAPGLPWTIGSLLLHRIDRRLARGVYLREAERYLAGLAVDSAVRAPTDQLDPGDEVAERLRAPVGCLLERASSVGSDSGHA